MKRENVTLFALLLLSLGQLWAQDQQKQPYKSVTEFNKDTLQYLEYNYNVARSVEYYKDKTVGSILQELEYPVSYIVEWGAYDNELISLSLGIRQKGKIPSPLEDYYIVVVFANPPKLSDFRVLYDDKNPKFTSQIYDFIKDLKVTHVTSNPYIITKRNNLEMRRKQEEKERQKQSDANNQNE